MMSSISSQWRIRAFAALMRRAQPMQMYPSQEYTLAFFESQIAHGLYDRQMSSSRQMSPFWYGVNGNVKGSAQWPQFRR